MSLVSIGIAPEFNNKGTLIGINTCCLDVTNKEYSIIRYNKKTQDIYNFTNTVAKDLYHITINKNPKIILYESINRKNSLLFYRCMFKFEYLLIENNKFIIDDRKLLAETDSVILTKRLLNNNIYKLSEVVDFANKQFGITITEELVQPFLLSLLGLNIIVPQIRVFKPQFIFRTGRSLLIQKDTNINLNDIKNIINGGIK